MIKTKIIFLDIDGVLRTIKDTKFNKKCIENINELVKITNSKVVITSTWRLNGMDFIMGNVGIYVNEIIDRTPYIISNHEDVEIPRGLEIKKWIQDYTNMYQYVESYVIIDDCDDILYSQKDRFIHVDQTKGFDKKSLKKAIEILNNITPTI